MTLGSYDVMTFDVAALWRYDVVRTFSIKLRRYD